LLVATTSHTAKQILPTSFSLISQIVYSLRRHILCLTSEALSTRNFVPQVINPLIYLLLGHTLGITDGASVLLIARLIHLALLIAILVLLVPVLILLHPRLVLLVPVLILLVAILILLWHASLVLLLIAILVLLWHSRLVGISILISLRLTSLIFVAHNNPFSLPSIGFSVQRTDMKKLEQFNPVTLQLS
jgi:hypothetical protein